MGTLLVAIPVQSGGSGIIDHENSAIDDRGIGFESENGRSFRDCYGRSLFSHGARSKPGGILWKIGT